jgi:hypothetical protein
MRDPMPYLAKYPDADVLTSSDHLAPTATDGGLEHHQRAASPANIGIMLIRHTAKELTTQWVEVLKREDYWCAPLPHTRHCGAKCRRVQRKQLRIERAGISGARWLTLPFRNAHRFPSP